MKYLLALTLLLSCSQAPTANKIQRFGEGGGCIYEGQFNYILIQFHWDELNGWAIPPMDDNAQFWGDSAIVLLNQIKHNESTMTCVPALTFDLATCYNDTLTTPPHQGGFGDQFTINIDFDGDYTPTAAERDSLVHLCNNAIHDIGIMQNDVHGRVTSHWYGHWAFDFSYSGGF